MHEISSNACPTGEEKKLLGKIDHLLPDFDDIDGAIGQCFQQKVDLRASTEADQEDRAGITEEQRGHHGFCVIFQKKIGLVDLYRALQHPVAEVERAHIAFFCDDKFPILIPVAAE